MLKYIMLLILLISQPLFANEYAGVVTVSKGHTINSTGHPILQGSMVYVGDEISTADKSFIVIQLVDGAKLTVRPDTTVTIKSYSTDTAEINLVTGGLRMITGGIAKTNPEKYTISTPVALLGVRGTEFSIQLCDPCIE